MATHTIRTRDKDTLARFLGWFSVGLGATQILAPKAMCKLVGTSGEGVSRQVMRAMGVRELTQGVGILVRPRPTMWVWSRVAGDALDLSLLGLVAARGNARRAAFGIANVVAVTVPDVYEARRLSRQQGPTRAAMPICKAVTINRPREEVEQGWAGARELRERVIEAGATVSFSAGSAGRGTELAVDFTQDPPAGELGGAVLKLSGKDLAIELAEDLRRFKQLVETGEIARSDSTPDGHLLAEHLRQRPAQPSEVAS
ncbi:MAG TPA: hypothetical protein VLD16_15930 [Gaiellaceae bacterium]|nr:hypothetical protein [Gaiellaceae bacterium]